MSTAKKYPVRDLLNRTGREGLIQTCMSLASGPSERKELLYCFHWYEALHLPRQKVENREQGRRLVEDLRNGTLALYANLKKEDTAGRDIYSVGGIRGLKTLFDPAGILPELLKVPRFLQVGDDLDEVLQLLETMRFLKIPIRYPDHPRNPEDFLNLKQGAILRHEPYFVRQLIVLQSFFLSFQDPVAFAAFVGNKKDFPDESFDWIETNPFLSDKSHWQIQSYLCSLFTALETDEARLPVLLQKAGKTLDRTSAREIYQNTRSPVLKNSASLKIRAGIS